MRNTLLSHRNLRMYFKYNISYSLLVHNQNLNIRNENCMAFEKFGEMFVGDFADMWGEKIYLVSIGGWATLLSMCRQGAMTLYQVPQQYYKTGKSTLWLQYYMLERAEWEGCEIFRF